MLNLGDFKQFDEHRYARHLVLKTDNLEILVVCWMPGQETVVHGHGPTDGVVFVLEGEIQSTSHLSDGKVVSAVSRKGDILHTPVGYRHKMANPSRNPCITLHVYAPPLGPEYLNPDLGYSNEVIVQEIPLSEDKVRFLMACPSRLTDPDDPGYTI